MRRMLARFLTGSNTGVFIIRYPPGTHLNCPLPRSNILYSHVHVVYLPHGVHR